MEMLVSRDWIRNKIAADPEMDAEAGVPAALLEDLGMFIPGDLEDTQQPDEKIVRLKLAFGVLIRQLRRRDELSINALAQRARIAEEELRTIEHDPHYKPRPRTVHQLAQYFKVPEREMMKLSGATRTFDAEFQEVAYRFAANSDDLSKLTDAERQALNEYVKYLNDRHER
jgi:transcriptional regulator with XRE-family HTH domain